MDTMGGINLREDGSEAPGIKLYGWREPGWNMDGSEWNIGLARRHRHLSALF
jgi:hypothetical protein